MPVGALIGAGASIIGGVLGSKATKSAAKTAADTSLQTAQMNNALASQIYNQNANALAPYNATGQAAMGQMNALLGLSPAAAPAQAQPAYGSTPSYGATPATSYAAYYAGAAGLPALTPDQIIYNNGRFSDPMGNSLTAQQVQAIYAGQNAPQTAPQTQTAPAAPATPTYNGGSPAGTANGVFVPPNYIAPHAVSAPMSSSFVNSAMNPGSLTDFKQSTGYQHRLESGMDAINTGYAGKGALQSGAAMKGIAQFGQDIASQEYQNYLGQLGKYTGYQDSWNQGERGYQDTRLDYNRAYQNDRYDNYLGLLANQQGIGLSATSAQAGVGQNYVNNVTANNNSAGQVAANAALMRGAANQNMYAGIGNALGQAAGAIWPQQQNNALYYGRAY